MSDEDVIGQLWQSTRERWRPEDVADLILVGIKSGQLKMWAGPVILRTLEVAAQHSWRRRSGYVSQMSREFFKGSVRYERQIEVLNALFPEGANSRHVTLEDTHALVEALLASIGGEKRLNKQERWGIGLKKGHRWYNKRRRLLLRTLGKLARQVEAEKRHRLLRASKVMLADRIPEETFRRSHATAAFVAYYVARMARRSVFTNQSQSQAFDTVSEVLLQAISIDDSTDWMSVARVMPAGPILRKLTADQRGRILGELDAVLREAAAALEGAWAGLPGVDPATMVVKRGCDSSTWNEAAGAWNQIRSAWLTLLRTLGLGHIVDESMPGKAMRVMAADVAMWHQASGGDVHPDTKVWAALPLPWRVLSGAERLTRSDVEAACRAAGVDPNNWTNAQGRERVAEDFRPTPELVHGVAVSSPALATALRRAGRFGGLTKARPDVAVPAVDVTRDEHGFAIGAAPSPVAANRLSSAIDEIIG